MPKGYSKLKAADIEEDLIKMIVKASKKQEALKNLLLQKKTRTQKISSCKENRT